MDLGERVKVTGMNGLVLRVKPFSGDSTESEKE